MFAIFCDVITFVAVDQLQSKLERCTRDAQPSALSIAFDFSRVRFLYHGLMSIRVILDTRAKFRRPTKTDKRPKLSDESEQTSSCSDILNFTKSFPILNAHMRAVVKHHQVTLAVHEFTLGIYVS